MALNTTTTTTSRPEPIFARSLGHYPMLRMQDLTTDEIRKFTDDNLHSLGMEPESMIELISDLFFQRAEGVFLWVVLVLQSVKQGLGNDDNWDILYRGISSLPTHLKDLYTDIWGRSNGESTYYLKEATLYFQLVIHHGHSFGKSRYSVPDLTVSTNDDWLEAFTQNGSLPSQKEVTERCTYVLRTLPSRSMGLLQVVCDDEAGSVGNDRNDGFELWFKTAVEFTHRTVIDFLVDDEDGRKIFEGQAYMPEDLCSRQITAAFILSHLEAANEHDLAVAILPLILRLQAPCASVSTTTLYSQLLLIGLRVDEFLGFLPSKEFGMSHQEIFLAGLSMSGFFDYVAKYLLEMEPVNCSSELLVLKASCARHVDLGIIFDGQMDGRHGDLSIPQSITRQGLIQLLLNRQGLLKIKPEKIKENPEIPHREIPSEVYHAWRCFLMHNLERVSDDHNGIDWKKNIQWNWDGILETIDLFISLGILHETSRQHYIVRIDYCQLFGVGTGRPVFTHLPSSHGWGLQSTYVEVNDDFLLQYITDHASGRMGRQWQSNLEMRPFGRLVMFRKPIRNRASSESQFVSGPKENEYYRPGSDINIDDASNVVDELVFSTPLEGSLTQQILISQSNSVFSGKPDDMNEAAALKYFGYELSEVDIHHDCVHAHVWKVWEWDK